MIENIKYILIIKEGEGKKLGFFSSPVLCGTRAIIEIIIIFDASGRRFLLYFLIIH